MPGTQRFEDLIAWQKARALTRAIYETSRSPSWADDLALRRQVQRAVVSVMSNIAEGYERSGDKEFGRFLAIAKASCAEVRSLLYVATDAGYIDEQRARTLLLEAEEVSRIISGLRTTVLRREETGGA